MNKLLIATTLVATLASTLASTSAMANFIPAFEAGGNAETGDNVWEFTDINTNQDDAGFHLTAQFGGGNSVGTREFGLYQYDAIGETMLNTLAIFSDSDMSTGVSATNVNLDFLGQTLATQYGSIDTSLAAGLLFGFYFESDGFTAYSQEAFNANGDDFFGFYDEADEFSPFNNHIYAEDGTGELDWITMSVSDIDTFRIVGTTTTTVPEPASALLMGAGLLGLAARRRKLTAV